ncbi:MAG: hypothetical protein NSGCLCUN01_01036 [uncultured Clostridium sp.]
MSDSTISKNKTLIIKGIAIILMVIHHLFAFPDRINKIEYVSIYLLNNVPIEFYVAKIGKICVNMFLFMGGYALFKIYGINVTYNKILKRIYKLYLTYWSVFIPFLIIGIIINKVELNLKIIFLNFIGIISTINKEWWFFIVYIILILLYPLIIKIILKYNNYLIFIISFCIFCVGTLANIIFYRLDIIKYELIFNIMSSQFMFITGIQVCKGCIFDKLSKKVNKKHEIIIIGISILILVLFPIKTLAYTITTPILIFAITRNIDEDTILGNLGKCSTDIWLIHTFFCYYYFQELTFKVKYSFMIIIWTIILSIVSSTLIKRIKKIFINIYYYNKIYNIKE